MAGIGVELVAPGPDSTDPGVNSPASWAAVVVSAAAMEAAEAGSEDAPGMPSIEGIVGIRADPGADADALGT